MNAPSPSETRAAREEASQRWHHLSDEPDLSLAQLEAAHANILAVAEDVSGTTLDARQRAVYYYSVFEDSQGNFMFPLVATHGSLWGVGHTRRLERMLHKIEPLSRHGRVSRWIEALDMVRDINRRVFVEIYSTFYFTRYYGTHPQADQVIKPEVLELYNRVHAAVTGFAPMDEAERREIYYAIFVHEQNDIVDPGIQDAAEYADSNLLKSVFKRVSPRFRYFPRWERLWFTDFTDVEQRNREGLRALAFAEEVGPERVRQAMGEYP